MTHGGGGREGEGGGRRREAVFAIEKARGDCALTKRDRKTASRRRSLTKLLHDHTFGEALPRGPFTLVPPLHTYNVSGMVVVAGGMHEEDEEKERSLIKDGFGRSAFSRQLSGRGCSCDKARPGAA